MSYLLIKKGGQKPSSGLPSNRNNNNNGQHRRNPAVSSSAHRQRPAIGGGSSSSSGGGGGGGGSNQWRNPSAQNGGNSFPRSSLARAGTSSNQYHHNDEQVNQYKFNAQHPHGVAVVNDGEGQVQLQRMAAPSLQRQQQVGPEQQQQQQQQQQAQNQVFQGLVSMDEVYADLQILEQQRQESERKLASARLQQKQKKAEQLTLESKLCELKCQNGGLRVELERAAKQLSLRHRELLEAQTKAESSRKDTHRFDAKLKRVIGVARLFGTYQNKIENAMIALHETETRLNFTKGQETSKLQSALIRRDDVIRRRDLLLKAINSNTTKARSIADEVSKIRAEIVTNEQDLSAAQRMESQTKLRVETIEHEVVLERTRHEETVAKLMSMSEELDESKVKSTQSSVEKKAAIERKKSELHKIWEKCNELLKSEGRSGILEPNWENEQAPSLDVARVWVRVNDEEVDLNSKMKERDQLRQDVADLDDQVSSNSVMATEKQTEADALQKFAETTSSEESVRKSEISKAIEDAERECREVEKLRDSILDLTVMQEKDATDLKMKQTSEESRISAMEAEIANIRDEVVSIEKRSLEHEERESAKNEKLLKEVAAAKKMADVIKGAFEHAQRQANRFSALPDGELALQMKQLDEAEREIVDVANLERDTIIEMEPLLEKFTLDFNSDVSFEDQTKAGMKSLRKACLNSLEEAKIDRQARLERAKEAHLREQVQRIREREEYFARIDEETRLADEARVREEEQEKRRRQDEEKSAAERKNKVAKLRKDRHAGTKANEIERRREEEVAARRHQKAVKMQPERNDKTTGSAAAETANNAESKRHGALNGVGRDENIATCEAAELKRRKDDKRLQESRKKRKIAEVPKEDKSVLEREARKEHELEAMRVRSKEMQERLKAEEERRDNVRRKDSKRDDKKSREDLGSMKPLRDETKFSDTNSNVNVGPKRKDRKSYGRAEGSRSKSKLAKPATSGADRSWDEQDNKSKVAREPTFETIVDETKVQQRKSSGKLENKISKPKPTKSLTKRAPEEPVDDANDTSEDKIKRDKPSIFTAASQLSLSSVCTKSAIKRKGSKSSKALSNVRFDSTADRPKLDIVMSGVESKVSNHAKTKPTKSSKFSLSISSTQTSGISSCESGGRRRKKPSLGGKSKAAILAMKGFDDDGGFL